MNQKILKYIKNYSYDTKDVNRLLVSAFLVVNNIKKVETSFIKEFIISDKEESVHVTEFIKLFDKLSFDIEDLIELFEFVISPVEKEVNGAVYTPKHIRDYIVKRSLDKLEAKGIHLDKAKISDIACGCGGFFFTLTEELKKRTNKSYAEIYRDNIYGLDIQKYSITRTEILLTLLAISNGENIKEYQFNLYTGNSLDFNWNSVSSINGHNGFDLVVGNPPYVGASKLDNVSLDLLKNWSVSAIGKPDLYIPFFQIGLELLTPSGILGYITMNSFCRSLNGAGIRDYIQENEFSFELVDFAAQQVFKGRRTYTCICIIGNEKGEGISHVKSNHLKLSSLKESSFNLIPYVNLDAKRGWTLAKSNVNRLIEKIEAVGSPLNTLVDIKNGLATLRNNIYVFKPIYEDSKIYKFEKNGKVHSVEKAICRNVLKPSILKTESQIEGNMEKIIFPYKEIKTKQKALFNISPNSSGIMTIEPDIFKKKFPKAFAYLNFHKNELSNRDKGKKEYEQWYSFGRSQGLVLKGNRLFFPYITNKPYFVFSDEQNLLFYNGFVLLSDNSRLLEIIKIILKSSVFWFYVMNVSRPYEKGYFSMGKRYIKNFGICELTHKEEEWLLSESNKSKITRFLLEKYDIPEKVINTI